MIRFHRPTGFIERQLSEQGMAATVTGARFIGGQVEYQIRRGGRDFTFREPEDACLRSFWVEGVTLTAAEYTPDGWLIYTVKER